MSCYRVTLAYDGTDFAGWQVQKEGGGARTVQGALEGALARLAAGARVRVTGAGRTDAGVHALGQVASFVLPREMDPAGLARALNAPLPGDVREQPETGRVIVLNGHAARRCEHRRLLYQVHGPNACSKEKGGFP